MSRPFRVLVTGGAGFVGRVVVRELLTRGLVPRVLVHEQELPASLSAGVEVVRGDLGDGETLRGIGDGVNAVIHAAIHLGEDPARCERINGAGTAALVAACAGVGRFVALSNCAIYGWAVHRGSDEAAVTVAPATPISRSRVSAERAVLGAGGTVLRPLFVYGVGDTKFVPAILKAARRLPFVVNGGRARVSVISVDELASILVSAAQAPLSLDLRGTFHVNDARPTSYAGILRALEQLLGTPRPRWSLPYPIARTLVRLTGAVSTSASAEHRMFLVSHDHWYDASRLRRLLAVPEFGGLPERLCESRDWYARFVRSA